MQYIVYFLPLFSFTFFPLLGLIFNTQILFDKYDLEGLSGAYILHILLIYLGVFIAFCVIKKKGYGWHEKYYIKDSAYYLKKIFWIDLLLTLIQFVIRGYAIFRGVDRGLVRTQLGVWGPPADFIGKYAVPALLSLATVLYYFYSPKRRIEKKLFRRIIILSLLCALMFGGKSSLISMLFPVIIQVGSRINIKSLFLILLIGIFSIIMIGTKQMNLSFDESVHYNMYRATTMASFGTVGVWNDYVEPCSEPFNSVIAGFGKNIVSYITGIPRDSPEFSKYDLSQEITYNHYPNKEGALTGEVNLTITAFGEAIYWGGHKYFFCFSAIFSLLLYKMTILVFKSRTLTNIRKNIFFTTFYTTVIISWLNSTHGSFLSQWFGFTTCIYLFCLHILLKFVLAKKN